MTFSSDTVEIIQQSQGGCCLRGNRAFAPPPTTSLGMAVTPYTKAQPSRWWTHVLNQIRPGS